MVAPMAPDPGFDMGGEPPETAACFGVMAYLMSSASWALGAVSGRVDREWVANGWPMMRMFAESLLSKNPTIIAPRGGGNPPISVTINGVAPTDDCLASIISPAGLAMLAMYWTLVLRPDERVAEFGLPKGLTLEGTADEWAALIN